MELPENRPPRVFISYSHDSTEHACLVLALANQLRESGIDALIDQYEIGPPDGWPVWMDFEIRRAEFVLLICTENYLRCVEGRALPTVGRGVLWEAKLIYNHLYLADSRIQKFLPILLCGGVQDHIPTPLRTLTYYRVDTETGFESLYRHLTHQPRHPMVGLGPLKVLPAEPIYADERRRPNQHFSIPPETSPIPDVADTLKEDAHPNPSRPGTGLKHSREVVWLEGVWVNAKGGMFCFKFIDGELFAVYSYMDSTALTGHLINCTFNDDRLISRFEWIPSPYFSGVIILERESENELVGRWCTETEGQPCNVVPVSVRNSSVGSSLTLIRLRYHPHLPFPSWAEDYFTNGYHRLPLDQTDIYGVAAHDPTKPDPEDLLAT